jgi:hypothetical protein
VRSKHYQTMTDSLIHRLWQALANVKSGFTN